MDDLVIRLLRSVDRLDSLQDKVATEGRLNLHQLLLAGSTGYDNDFFNAPYVFKYCDGYWCRLNHSLTREPDENTYSPDTGNRSAWFQWTAHGDGLMHGQVVVLEGTSYRMKDRIEN